MSVTVDKVRSIIGEIAAEIESQKQFLSDLDQAIGDGDHGFNMARGFGVTMEKLRATPGTTIADVLKTVAMALISNVGGASGPLYGTMFLKMSTAVGPVDTIDLPAFAAAFREGIAGVQMRGKAELGEKTMLDVLIPVGALLDAEAAAGTTAAVAFAKVTALAAEKCAATKDIVATKGRASYLGERSIGHVDPGATSSKLMLDVIAKSLGA
jgi:dihydroxyacetone kinase-like protein